MTPKESSTPLDKLQNLPFDPDRAVYLAAYTRVAIPKKFGRYIVNDDILNAIATQGLEGAKVYWGMEGNQLDEMYRRGFEQSPSSGTEQEWRLRIAGAVSEGVHNSSIPFAEKLNILGNLYKWHQSSKVDDLVIKEQGNVEDGKEITHVKKWQSGFSPYDTAMGDGFYNGVHLVMAAPGTGKTSTMLILFEQFVANKVAPSVWYFSLETPIDLVRSRMAPLRRRTKFRKGKDQIFAGLWSPQEIMELIAEDPDPNRIILYDSPDVLAQGENKRHILEDIYRDLVKIKGICKAVFTASQPRREENGLSLQSVAESWSKAWFADSVTGISRQGGETSDGQARLIIQNFKNRFGPSMGSMRYGIDYATFDWQEWDALSGNINMADTGGW